MIDPALIQHVRNINDRGFGEAGIVVSYLGLEVDVIERHYYGHHELDIWAGRSAHKRATLYAHNWIVEDVEKAWAQLSAHERLRLAAKTA